MTIQGYLHFSADSAFGAACRANDCLIDLGSFAIIRIAPALAQVWRRGRFDTGTMRFSGEWRVPAWIRMEGDTIPEEAWAFLRKMPGFLDLRAYTGGET